MMQEESSFSTPQLQPPVPKVFPRWKHEVEEYFTPVGSQFCVQSKCNARPRLRRRRRRQRQGGLARVLAAGRLLEIWTWEMMRAESGTWAASVGLSELMRDSIFSASLLQASI